MSYGISRNEAIACDARHKVARTYDSVTFLNRLSGLVKFWRGQSLEDWGYLLESGADGRNGNPPALYAVSPNGNKYQWDNCFHCWLDTYQ